jgi:hypothetical protein
MGSSGLYRSHLINSGIALKHARRAVDGLGQHWATTRFHSTHWTDARPTGGWHDCGRPRRVRKGSVEVKDFAPWRTQRRRGAATWIQALGGR